MEDITDPMFCTCRDTQFTRDGRCLSCGYRTKEGQEFVDKFAESIHSSKNNELDFSKASEEEVSAIRALLFNSQTIKYAGDLEFQCEGVRFRVPQEMIKKALEKLEAQDGTH